MTRSLLLVLVLSSSPALADKSFDQVSDGDSWDCAGDPVVNISYGEGSFTAKGACTEINLNGSELKLTIESTATLNVNGAENVVTVAELGAVKINGVGNKVTWKKAKTGKKPRVATNGKGNAVVKAK